jgi:flagellar protein FliS
MMQNPAKSAFLKSYAAVGVQSGIESASAHRLILMLLDGALEKVAFARGHMARKNVEGKGSNISWAISIVGGLRGSLDLDAGGPLAADLDALYEYITIRLLEANAQNDEAKLEEVHRLLAQVHSAWKAIEAAPEATVGRVPAPGTATRKVESQVAPQPLPNMAAMPVPATAGMVR